jgi:phosphoglycerol transferase MdoB-like AlkP superfamily enzyme
MKPGRDFARTRLAKTITLAVVVLAVFSAARLYFLILNRRSLDTLDTPEILGACLLGLRFDVSAAFMGLIVPFGLMNLPFRFATSGRWVRAWAWVACVLTCLMALLLIADANFFSYTGRHLSDDLVILGEKTTTHEMANHAVATAIAMLSVLAIVFAWRSVLKIPLADEPRRPFHFAALVGVMVLGIRGHVRAGRPLSVGDAYRSGSVQGNLTLNGAFSLVKGVSSARQGLKRKLSPEGAFQRVRALYPQADPACPFMKQAEGPATGVNVVLILLESWAPKYVDCLSGGSLGATPNFDVLAAKGRLFRRFYAAGIDSQMGLQAALAGFPKLPGMPYLGRGTLETRRFTCLGGLATRRGYRTLFVQPSERHAWSFDSVARMLGFKDYFSREDIPLRRTYPAPEPLGNWWDYEALMFTFDRINTLGKPFLALAFTGKTHEPFADPGETFHLRPHGSRSEDGYLNTLHYADWSLGEFMRAAEQADWFAKTVFVLFGDHSLRAIPDVGLLSRDLRDRYHVPMLLYAPGRIEPGVVDSVCSQVDVLPTLMELLGFDEPYSAMGRSLLHHTDERAFVTDGSTVGIITKDGYVSHDLEIRRATGGTASEAEFRAMEDILLTLDAATYYAVQANCWLRATTSGSPSRQ